MPYTVIAYLRVSTDKQADSGLGLEAQRASVTAAAARLGLELRAVLVDAGVSGSLSIADRPVLMQAVDALRRGDVLLVAKRDRLGRDVIAVAMIERLIAKRGARVVSAAGEGTDNEDPSNVLMRRLIDSFSEYERLIIGARTKSALAAKRARGERVGGLPFGYRLAADAVQLEADASEQGILARITALRAEGLTTRRIADALNQDGFRTRKGTPWRFQYVARALRSAGECSKLSTAA
jgi:DNA invertase Pin-like site-specific DNA recombinase